MSDRPPTASSSSSSTTAGGTGTGTGSNIDADSLLASTLLRIRTDDSLAKPNQHQHQTSSVLPTVTEAVAPTRVSPIISLAPRSSTATTQAAMTTSSGGGQQPNMQLPTPNAAAANFNSSASRMGRGGVSMAPMAGMFGIVNNNHQAGAYGSADHHHHHAGITLEQINALQVLAANRAASFAAMAAASSGSPLHRNANFAAAAPSPSLRQFDRMPTSSPTTSSTPQGQLALAPSARTPSVRQQLAAEVALHMSDNHDYNESTSAAAAAAAAAIVRKEQVEAALRSKPQRGRKREELSELERMELTRTRNREHARSTRIRKKARYQELLDYEQQLEDVLKQESVQHKRRRAVLEFLALRSSMLLSNSAGDPQEASNSNRTADISKLLNELVEDPDQFCFRFNEFCSSSSNKDNVDRLAATAAALSSSSKYMKNFDNQLVNRVVGIFGKTVLPFVCYSIKGSHAGGSKNNGESSIALDLGHGAFANVEISLVRPAGGNNNEEKILLMTGVMQFDFTDSDKKSDKLRSVVWSTTRDFLNDLSDGLVSHPSVVSLDPAMSLIQESASSASASSSEAAPNPTSPQEKQLEGGGGPGMSI